MPTEIDIANRALLKIGAERITNFEDESKEAQAIRLCWEAVRDREIAAYPWAFSLRRASLPALAEAPAWGYANQYQLPEGFLGLHWVDGYDVSSTAMDYLDGTESAWRVEGGKILTDREAPLKIIYYAREVDPQQWGAQFCEVMALALAIEICDDVTGDLRKKQGLQQDKREAIAMARRLNAIQQAPRAIPDGSWITERT